MNVPEQWKSVLQHRSVADKFCIPRDCELCPTDDLPAISEMVRGGFVVWVGREMFKARIGSHEQPPDKTTPFSHFECDIYQLTTMGIRLCNENGIKQV